MLHESFPSPVTSASLIAPTVNQPAASTPYITQVALTMPTVTPPIGMGYTKIRVCRTQDGGATFFLLPNVYNASGTPLEDNNGAVAITASSMTLYHGVAASSIAPAADFLSVNAPGGAPAPGANNPPPNAIWGAVYQSRLWLLDPDGSRLLKFIEIESAVAIQMNGLVEIAS